MLEECFILRSGLCMKLHVFSSTLTGPSAIWKPKNRSIIYSYVVLKLRAGDFEAPKLWKGRSGYWISCNFPGNWFANLAESERERDTVNQKAQTDVGQLPSVFPDSPSNPTDSFTTQNLGSSYFCVGRNRRSADLRAPNCGKAGREIRQSFLLHTISTGRKEGTHLFVRKTYTAVVRRRRARRLFEHLDDPIEKHCLF